MSLPDKLRVDNVRLAAKGVYPHKYLYNIDLAMILRSLRPT